MVVLIFRQISQQTCPSTIVVVGHCQCCSKTETAHEREPFACSLVAVAPNACGGEETASLPLAPVPGHVLPLHLSLRFSPPLRSLLHLASWVSCPPVLCRWVHCPGIALQWGQHMLLLSRRSKAQGLPCGETGRQFLWKNCCRRGGRSSGEVGQAGPLPGDRGVHRRCPQLRGKQTPDEKESLTSDCFGLVVFCCCF